MLKDNAIWMGVGAEPTSKPVSLLLDQANRHGLIAGASGTGKTVTLKVMAEGFSKAGVPVFMADVKGDITGMCSPGEDTEDMQKRIKKFGLEGFTYEGCPCRFWDMLGGQGIPVRITVSDMGPMLLARLLELTEVQEGVLDIVFRIADDKNLLLIDLKDLRSMLNYVAENAKEYETTYGKVSSQSVGAILRQLISVEDQGGDVFFGEPDLDLSEWFACDSNGHGYVNVLNAAKLIQSPSDIPDEVLAQLSNRVQHGLRAYTPAEQKAVRAAAQSFRENPAFKSEDAILELGTGEALVSFLNDDGQPEIVERAKILPPQCLMAAAPESDLKAALDAQADLMKKYGEAVDRESAFEQLDEVAKQDEEAKKLEAERAELEKEKAKLEKEKAKAEARAEKAAEKARQKQQDQFIKGIGKVAGTIFNTFGREATRQITRNLFGGRRR